MKADWQDVVITVVTVVFIWAWMLGIVVQWW